MLSKAAIACMGKHGTDADFPALEGLRDESARLAQAAALKCKTNAKNQVICEKLAETVTVQRARALVQKRKAEGTDRTEATRVFEQAGEL